MIQLFDKKDEIIRKIVELKELKDELKTEFLNMKLNELDDNIRNLISKNMVEIKNKIKVSQRGQKAFSSYNAVNRAPNFYSRIL